MNKFIRDIGVAVISGIGVQLGLQLVESTVKKVQEVKERKKETGTRIR
jgi:two-component sensor histidine kinase